MLKAMLSAIVAGLKACARMVGTMLLAPLRMIRGADHPDVLPEIELPPPYEAQPEDRTQIYQDIARAIMNWALDSITAGRPVALPAGLPLAVKEWLPGLRPDECWELMEANPLAVSKHIQGLSPLSGVRTVQSLPWLEEWPAERLKTATTGLPSTAVLPNEPARV